MLDSTYGQPPIVTNITLQYSRDRTTLWKYVLNIYVKCKLAWASFTNRNKDRMFVIQQIQQLLKQYYNQMPSTPIIKQIKTGISNEDDIAPGVSFASRWSKRLDNGD